jgi:hypothetical protein
MLLCIIDRANMVNIAQGDMGILSRITYYFHGNSMAEWQNGRTAEQQNGRTAERQNGRTAEWQNGRTAERQNGRTATY